MNLLKTAKKIFKIIGYFTLFIIVFLAIYFISAYTLSKISVNNEKKEVLEGINIYILSTGVHTDIVLPIKSNHIDWSNKIKFEQTPSKDSLMEYISIGWGDKGFYLETPTWADLTFRVAFKAMFFLGESAMHTTFYKNMKEDKNCKRIKITHEEYKKLVQYILDSFEYDKEGNPIFIKAPSYGKHDTFYEATRTYSLFFTCNTWANNALKSCDQKACLWTPSDDGIFQHYP